MLNYLTRNSDNLLIGRFIGGEELGLYSKAYGLMLLPMQRLMPPVTQVAIPTLSRLQDQPDRYRRFYLTALRLACWVTMPVGLFLVVFAEPAILLVLGPKFADAADIFWWLSLTVPFQAAGSTFGWLFITSGRTADLLKISLVVTPLYVGAFALGITYGVLGVAQAYAISYLVLLVPIGMSAARGSAVNVSQMVTAMWRPLVSAIFAAATSVGLWYIMPLSFPNTSLCAFAFCGVYFAIAIGIFDARNDIADMNQVKQKHMNPVSA